MSFDTWLAGGNGGDPVSLDALRAWFAERPHYTLEGQDKTLASYDNEETGVYFWFEFGQIFAPEDVPQTDRPVEVFLGVNYGRPIPFGMEAVHELAAVCETFGLLTCDPQENETGYRAFQTDRFLASWRRHARWATSKLVKDHGMAVRPVAGRVLEEVWRWNYERPDRQKQLGIDVFIPRMFLFEVRNRITTGIVWSDGVPTLIPACESICLVRRELAPRTFLQFGASDRTELLPRQVFAEIWREYYRPGEQDPTLLRPRAVERPKGLAKALRKLNARGIQPEILPFDAVIDVELLQDE